MTINAGGPPSVRPLQWSVAVVLSAVVVISLVIGGCGEEYQDPLPPRDGPFYPIGLEMHPDGRFLYVVNSNFNLRYRSDQGGTVMVVDTDTGDVLAESSPYIPSFGSHLALNEDASKVYVPSRHDNELTVLSVAGEGQALFCDDDDRHLADSRPCTARRIPDVSDGTRFSSDPFGVAVGQISRDVEGVETDFDLVHLSYLRGNDVTTVSFPDGRMAGASMRSAALMGQGGNQLQMRPGTDEVYVAGRGANRVEGFWPYVNATGEVEALVRSHSIPILERGSGMDARGLTFDDTGQWLYVVTRQPNALHVVGMDPPGGGSPEVVTTVALEQRPSEVHAHRGADGVMRLYIPSYRQGVVEVVEPNKEAVVDTIDVGRSPYAMTTERAPARCAQPGRRCQGYVSLFDAGENRQERCDDDARHCGAIAIVDLDPDSDTFHTVIDTIE